MNFSVGYQLEDSGAFLAAIHDCRERVEEIYFSLPDLPNGRGVTTAGRWTRYSAQAQQDRELSVLAALGLGMNLLLNATCYGENALSRAFFEDLGDTIDHAVERYAVSSVTTTSPVIAKFVKQNFSDIAVRASVNMSIGTVEGMEYLSDYFDEFYLKRESNRDFAAIRALHGWCAAHGKTLRLLANSGCLNHCSAHTFHDNLVSHERAIRAMDNAYAFPGLCRDFLRTHDSAQSFLDHTNFIRPEDLHLYEAWFSSVKLATRVHAAPDRVLRAYCAGAWYGCPAGLLEPNHSAIVEAAIPDGHEIKAEVYGDRLRYGWQATDH